MSISGGQFVQIPVFNQLVPDENPRSIRIRYDLVNQDDVIVDLNNAIEAKVISNVQTIYFDNADNPNNVTMQIEVTNQRLIFPAYSQGYIPVLCPNPPKFTLSSQGGIGSITMLNVPMPAIIWSIPQPQP